MPRWKGTRIHIVYCRKIREFHTYYQTKCSGNIRSMHPYPGSIYSIFYHLNLHVIILDNQWKELADNTTYINFSANTLLWEKCYRIAGNFRMVLIFVYFVCSIPYTKIKTAKI